MSNLKNVLNPTAIFEFLDPLKMQILYSGQNFLFFFLGSFKISCVNGDFILCDRLINDQSSRIILIDSHILGASEVHLYWEGCVIICGYLWGARYASILAFSMYFCVIYTHVIVT